MCVCVREMMILIMIWWQMAAAAAAAAIVVVTLMGTYRFTALIIGAQQKKAPLGHPPSLPSKESRSL